MDNYSSCSAEDVINLAKRYHVPIFVIGIGYEDYSYARNQSYGYIELYILSGSALEAEQRKYVTRGISENIDSYEIENVEYADNNNCFVTTRETYFVQKPGEPLSFLTQRCKYSVVKSGNEWKMTGFADKIEVLARIAY